MIKIPSTNPNYIATRSDENGEGDFINSYLHDQSTAFISRNTLIVVYMTA